MFNLEIKIVQLFSKVDPYSSCVLKKLDRHYPLAKGQEKDQSYNLKLWQVLGGRARSLPALDHT